MGKLAVLRNSFAQLRNREELERRAKNVGLSKKKIAAAIAIQVIVPGGTLLALLWISFWVVWNKRRSE